jgi:hypothetical protein
MMTTTIDDDETHQDGTMKKRLKLTLGVLCLLPLIGLADLPASAPGGAEGGGATGGREGRIRGGSGAQTRPRDGGMPLRRFGRDFSPSDEQIAKAEAFVQEHSPNRFKAYKQATGPNHGFLVKSIVRGYFELKALETEDPALYGMKMDQLATEDAIFGIVAAARESQLPKEKLRDQVRPLVSDLLAKRKEEMQHRIDKLELAKIAETRRLNELNSIGDAWIDKRIDEEMNHNGRFTVPGAKRAGADRPAKATSSASE